MKNDQLNCRVMFKRLSEYIDGDLDARLLECVDEHMRDCEPCQAFIATLRKTVELCRIRLPFSEPITSSHLEFFRVQLAS